MLDAGRTRLRPILMTTLTTLVIPMLYVMVETRFPRRVESPEISLTPQGESA